MEKESKYFLWIIVFGLFVGIFVAMNMPKHSKNITEEIEIKKAVSHWNSDMPRKIGTIGIIDSIVYHNRTITYNITVFGDNDIKEVYKKSNNEFRDILEYSLLAMNGQHNMGSIFSSILDQKELNLDFRVYTQDGDATEWKMSGS